MGGSGFSVAQAGAVLVGIVYLAVGLIGFAVTGFDNFVVNTNDDLLGFDVNPFHNLFHFLVGVYLLIVAAMGRTVTEGALIGGGIVYLVAAFLGFDNRLQIISINDAFASDNFLHLVSGSVALLLGVASALTNRPERPRNAIQQR